MSVQEAIPVRALCTVLPTTWFLTQEVVFDYYLLFRKMEKFYVQSPSKMLTQISLYDRWYFILYVKKQLT